MVGVMDYAGHYQRLIERARDRALTGYSERHHIVPRCMGGGDEPENLVDLTPEEHYVAHQLLVKMNPGHRGVIYAAVAMTMSGKGRARKNKLYGWLRRSLPDTLTEETKRKLSCAMKGQTPLGERNAEIEKLYKGGMLLRKIAERYGITQAAIWNILADRDVIRRGMDEKGCGRGRRGYSSQDVAKLAAMLSPRNIRI